MKEHENLSLEQKPCLILSSVGLTKIFCHKKVGVKCSSLKPKFDKFLILDQVFHLIKDPKKRFNEVLVQYNEKLYSKDTTISQFNAFHK